jgi:hypothetical protein
MEIIIAAEELIRYIKEKHKIKYSDEFDCPYMRLLAEAIDESNKKRIFDELY